MTPVLQRTNASWPINFKERAHVSLHHRPHVTYDHNMSYIMAHTNASCTRNFNGRAQLSPRHRPHVTNVCVICHLLAHTTESQHIRMSRGTYHSTDKHKKLLASIVLSYINGSFQVMSHIMVYMNESWPPYFNGRVQASLPAHFQATHEWVISSHVTYHDSYE